MEEIKYDEFIDEYEKLCRKTGYCLSITNGGELHMFWVSSMEEEFNEHIAELRGGTDD